MVALAYPGVLYCVAPCCTVLLRSLIFSFQDVLFSFHSVLLSSRDVYFLHGVLSTLHDNLFHLIRFSSPSVQPDPVFSDVFCRLIVAFAQSILSSPLSLVVASAFVPFEPDAPDSVDGASFDKSAGLLLLSDCII